ncbi:MAG: DinB family protein [Candidatus Krumholzibacteriia bacterium]
MLHHPADGEREDFPLRLRLTLEDPERPWPPIDPPGWVVARAYNRQDPDAVLKIFLAARRANLDWLRRLEDPAWENTCPHPRLGPMPARRLLHAWCGHDVLHLRQMLQRRWWLREQAAGPGELAYAGSW